MKSHLSSSKDVVVHPMDQSEYHVSLSRPFVLRHHHIDPFVKALRKALREVKRYVFVWSHRMSHTYKLEKYKQVHVYIRRLQGIHKRWEHAIFRLDHDFRREDRGRFANRDITHIHTVPTQTSLQFIDLIRKIDSVLIDFRATPYYESPQPHVSVAWHSGPCPSTIKPGHTKFTTKETDSFQALEVVCKIGNKSHVFPLV